MWSKLAVATGGLALAVALGVPVGAQAAVTPSGAAHVGAPAGMTPDTSTNCNSNGTLYDVGNGKYATLGDTENLTHALYFNPYSVAGADYFCAVNYGGNEYNIMQPADLTGDPHFCVSVDAANKIVGWESACGNTWDKWEPTRVGTYHSQAVYILKNVYNGQCLYDYKQNPAIYSTCNASDGFEQFVFDSLP